ncbi:right-handed parallel beta-helix repeat-containing protein [Bacteroidota bacterium]
MKNLLQIILIAFFLICNNLFAETVIPEGEVSGTWTKADSPYYISGNVLIPDTATLKIEPGVLIEFKDSCRMTVKGQLLAVGSENDSIIFSVKDKELGWLGIHFDKILNHNDSSIIKFCVVHFCTGEYAFLLDSSSKIQIQNSRFSNNDNRGHNYHKGLMLSVIYCSYSNPLISNNVFINNGVINRLRYCAIMCNHSSPQITNCLFSNNISYYGSSLYCFNESQPVIDKCNFTNENGQSIFIVDYCFPIIKNSNIFQNSGNKNGGAIYCSNSDAIIDNCMISENSGSNGGAICIDHNSNLILKNSIISKNTSTKFGGAIFSNDGNLYINNCLISENRAEKSGSLYIDNGSILITNSTIVENFAEFAGGIDCFIDPDSNNYYKLYNTIIFKNQNGNIRLRDNSIQPDFINCSIEGGIENFIFDTDTIFNGVFENCVISDPRFSYNSSASYTLLQNSPCINSGLSDTSGLNLPIFDLLGNDRIVGSRVDIGAYEFQGEPVGEQELEFYPKSITFSPQKVGTLSQKQSLIIRNEGFEDLILELFCSPNMFKIKKENDINYKSSISLILNPSQEEHIDVVFEPDKSELFTGNINIASNDSDEDNIDIELMGRGTNILIFSGEITNDTCWVDSVYIVGDVFIPDSITLCIEPGTHIVITGNYKIDVKGRLLAIGERDKIITFTVYDTTGISDLSSNNGGWLGIRFKNINEFNDSSKIIYCSLKYCKNMSKDYYDSNGGALYCSNVSKLLIDNCSITNNIANGSGGGIYCESSTFTLSNSKILHNTSADQGGGVYTTQSNILIVNNTIEGNISIYGGGGIFSKESNDLIIKNVIKENITTNNDRRDAWGGGIYSTNGAIISNLIIRNSSDDIGSGIYTEKTNIINNVICENYGSYWGAGISVFNTYTSLSYIINNTISKNEKGGILLFYSSPKILNCIIFDNIEHQIHFEDDYGDPVAYNCTKPDILYTDLEGGLNAIEVIGRWGYNGRYEDNIDADPSFSNDPDNPYSLSENSPCINAGAPDTTGFDIPLYDIISMPRIHAGRIDIGAYEFQGEVSVKELRDNNYIMVYPNPTDGLIIIDIIKPDLLPLSIEIIDIFGRVVKKEIINEIHNRFDLSQFPNGHYYLTIRNNNIFTSKKFIIYK